MTKWMTSVQIGKIGAILRGQAATQAAEVDPASLFGIAAAVIRGQRGMPTPAQVASVLTLPQRRIFQTATNGHVRGDLTVLDALEDLELVTFPHERARQIARPRQRMLTARGEAVRAELER